MAESEVISSPNTSQSELNLYGRIVAPAAYDSRYTTWKSENPMVMSWLLGSMIPEISDDFILYDTAAEFWSAAAEMYSKRDNTA